MFILIDVSVRTVNFCKDKSSFLTSLRDSKKEFVKNRENRALQAFT